MNKKNLNVPNLLSAYRIVALPFIIYSLFAVDRGLFISLIIVNLLTDILDGWIARRFKLETELGARLDSLADIGTLVMAVCGMIVFESDFVVEKSVSFGSMVGLFVAFEIISLMRFRRFPSLHLYSSKIVGYLQGIFIITYFLFGYASWYFYLMIVFTIISYLEEIAVLLYIPRMRSNCRGLYWLIRENKISNS